MKHLKRLVKIKNLLFHSKIHRKLVQNVYTLTKQQFLCGEVTVFLSIVLILMLSLIGTLLESARIDVAKGKASRILDNSMNYIFSEYCRPLWEDYHVFFLEGEDSEELMKKKLISILDQCEKFSLEMENQEQNFLKLNMLGLEKLETEIGDFIYADSKDGAVFGKEVTEYMKYHLLENETIKEQKFFQDFSTMNHTMKVIHEQLKAEKKMGEYNKKILQIIGAIDGIFVGKNGIERSWSGKLKAQPAFVKQICPDVPTKRNVGISNDEIWQLLKSYYINPIVLLENMEKELRNLDEKRREREAKENEKMEQNDKRKEETFIRLSKLDFPNKLIHKNAEQNKLVTKIKEIINIIEQIEKLYSDLEKEEQEKTKLMKQWKNVYNQEREKLPLEFQSSMEKEMNCISNESGELSRIKNNIWNIKPYLIENKKILQQAQVIGSVTWGDGEQEIKDNLRLVAEVKNIISKYHVKELAFDYKGFIKKKEKNPIKSIPSDMKKGVLPYVIEDTNLISKKEKQYDTDNPTTDCKMNNFSDLGSINEFNKIFNGEQWLKQLVEEKLDSICLSKYIKSHFNNFHKAGERTKKAKKKIDKNEKETILDYEQEYIVGGKKSDWDNLEAVVMRLLLMRVIFNYYYLFTDKQASTKAYITAQGIVGFTCMEPLVQFTKQLILLVWAVEEAIIDAGGLLAGKQIALWKDKASFMMKYEELLRFNKKFVHKKIKEIPKGKKMILSDYQSYLGFLINFTKYKARLERTMDEIEDNMRIRYDENFKFSSCVYGFCAIEKYYLAPKFLQLPFVVNFIKCDNSGWTIEESKTQCY